MPSSHLILCRPLLLLPPIPPSIRVFSNESALCMRWPKYWSFSFSIIPSSPWNSLVQNTGVGSLPFFRGSSQPRNRTGVSCIAGRFFTNWAITEAQIVFKIQLSFSLSKLHNFMEKGTLVVYVSAMFMVSATVWWFPYCTVISSTV